MTNRLTGARCVKHLAQGTVNRQNIFYFISERDRTHMTLDAILFLTGSLLGFVALLGAALALLTIRKRGDA